ncbi:MAG TPA: hypothetical protein VK233_06255 [Candidatus Dormibacteraeota bacterium]|nr:hypothetical protein [Candidatus Dormibacteraeota bacterium]
MATLQMATRAHPRLGSYASRAVVVGFTLATAAIHTSLGGMMFLANAVGYTTLALAMVAPGPIGQIRWLVRLALMGFTAMTIGGWLLFGARFPLAYLDKAIEVALIAVLAFELWRTDGGPIGVARKAQRLLGRLAGLRTARTPR